ncbi:Protein of unknown function [Gryllus bimaculatus]|nr:Protein of unknown function [Gryllus bimaculatus]
MLPPLLHKRTKVPLSGLAPLINEELQAKIENEVRYV